MATIGLSALTKKWVEDPVREARHLGLARSGATFAYAAAAAVLLTVVCVVPRAVVDRDAEHAVEVAQQIAHHEPPCFGAAAMTPQAKGCPNDDLDGVMVPTPDAAAKDDPPWSKCYWRAFNDPLVPCRFGKPDARLPHVAVIGDSHARVLMATVDRLVQQGRITADMYVMGECAWSTAPVDMSREIGRTCAHWRSNLFPLLDRRASQYDLVLTTARLVTLTGATRPRCAVSRRPGAGSPHAACRWRWCATTPSSAIRRTTPTCAWPRSRCRRRTPAARCPGPPTSTAGTTRSGRPSAAPPAPPGST